MKGSGYLYILVFIFVAVPAYAMRGRDEEAGSSLAHVHQALEQRYGGGSNPGLARQLEMFQRAKPDEYNRLAHLLQTESAVVTRRRRVRALSSALSTSAADETSTASGGSTADESDAGDGSDSTDGSSSTTMSSAASRNVGISGELAALEQGDSRSPGEEIARILLEMSQSGTEQFERQHRFDIFKTYTSWGLSLVLTGLTIYFGIKSSQVPECPDIPANCTS